MSASNRSSSVLRAIKILEALCEDGYGAMTSSEIAQKLGVSKSTAHRYLATLESEQMVSRSAGDAYALGPKLAELASRFLARLDLRSLSQETMTSLGKATSETVHLAIQSGNVMVYVDKVESPHSVRMSSHIGANAPLHSTALGKSVLAYNERLLEGFASAGVDKRTKYTIVSREDLAQEMAKVRRQGFAIDNQENEIGVRCVGAPIFDYAGKPVAAISVSAPANRMSQEEAVKLGEHVRRAGAEISARMGYTDRSASQA